MNSLLEKLNAKFPPNYASLTRSLVISHQREIFDSLKQGFNLKQIFVIISSEEQSPFSYPTFARIIKDLWQISSVSINKLSSDDISAIDERIKLYEINK
jgi:Family of unknown function (DUF5338)